MYRAASFFKTSGEKKEQRQSLCLSLHLRTRHLRPTGSRKEAKIGTRSCRTTTARDGRKSPQTGTGSTCSLYPAASTKTKAQELQLHVFCDASKDAIGAVAYLRAEREGKVSISFLAATSKVTALEAESIPHCELKAARLGVKLAAKLIKSLRLAIDETFFWTDSQVVLHWLLKLNRRHPRYVPTQRDAILKSSSASQWRFVPSHLNPADDVTRGIDAKNLKSSHRFYTGPEFLYLAESFWPQQNLIAPAEIDDIAAVYKISAETEKTLELVEQAVSLTALKRSVADSRDGLTRPRTVIELQTALRDCLIAVQLQHFGDELRDLSAGKDPQRSSRLRKLTPFLDEEGLLRVGGRLTYANNLSREERHPIILPSEGKLTELIISHTHIALLHSPTERTHTELRATYWILKGRRTVNRILQRCEECRRLRALPQQPQMAPLPEARVTAFQPAFFNTGVDYMGPFYITVKRSVEKRWICLFTCLSTRAVHLELAQDLSSASFLNMLTIFSSLRGKPGHIYCDNGTNLRGGARILQDALKEELGEDGTRDLLASKGIEFHFNPPEAPHMGGAWERLVRTVKRAMGPILHDKTVKEEVLRTALAAATGLINGRPLTRLGVNPDDLRPLTPNHFLLGRENNITQPGSSEEADGGLDRNRWIASQQLIDLFWRRWLREYLPTLTERHKWEKKTRNSRVGDIVLIVDAQAPRGQWITGRVSGVFKGKDGAVRSVLVAVGSKEYRRPVNKTCLLRAVEEDGGPGRC